MAKRAKAPKHYRRCLRCHSLIPATYSACGMCGDKPTPADALFVKALAMFPGSREIKNGSST